MLCQQPLTATAAERLSRFQAFITDTTSRDADQAERQLHGVRERLTALQAQPAAITAALSHLQANGEDVSEVEAWLATAAQCAADLVSWIDEPGKKSAEPVASFSSEALEERRVALSSSAEAIDATSFDSRIRELRLQIAEAQSSAQLSAAKANLMLEVERLKQRAKIEAARRLTDTTGITRRATDLTTTHVTTLVRDHFTRETERVGLRRVTLDHTGGRKNVTLEHRPQLLGASTAAPIDTVLSEGEQTALGLAGFLTEVEFDDVKSAIVLDDPVSSLDAGRRSRVAKRLVELAQERQVIVFTHEATFVTALNKCASDNDVAVEHQAVLRQGDLPGKTSGHHPWSVKDTKQRLHELDTALARLEKERPGLDSDEYTRRAQEWAGRLSRLWERAVNLEVVNELVDRGTNEVRPRMFKMLVGISDKDNTDYQSGYAKTSEWAPRHDQAPEVNFIAPDIDELRAELDRFEGWYGRIRSYKK